ncbi:MAG: glycosyltransferase family 4 protein [Chloroflexota bacterium]
MRIAIASPIWERVPPPAYGGIEAVVSLVANGLARRGHDVTLYATGDSITSARLRSVCPRSLRAANVAESLPYQLVHASSVITEAGQYDVIHNHCGELLMTLAGLAPTAMLTTIHGPMVPDSQIVWDHYAGYYNTISLASKDGFPDRGYLGVVYNGIDVESFPFTREKDDYLLFLGRLSLEKGTHVALQAARALGQRLVIAGKVDRVDQGYFDSQVAPLLDDPKVSFVGEADAIRKRELFAGARCLLHPVSWPEPFGLVMAEAMACGTPVIAFGRGSIPEVVAHGETGFVVDSLDGMIDAVHHLGEIDPERCRSWVNERFSAEGMVSGYEELYARIASD